jgi:hypothetical protein
MDTTVPAGVLGFPDDLLMSSEAASPVITLQTSLQDWLAEYELMNVYKGDSAERSAFCTDIVRKFSCDLVDALSQSKLSENSSSGYVLLKYGLTRLREAAERGHALRSFALRLSKLYQPSVTNLLTASYQLLVATLKAVDSALVKLEGCYQDLISDHDSPVLSHIIKEVSGVFSFSQLSICSF